MVSIMIRLSLAVSCLASMAFGYDSERGAAYSRCPPLPQGSFDIHQFQLHPDTASFDSNNCVMWISSLFNASVVKYDPYSHQVLETKDFPSISEVWDTHGSGIHLGQDTGVLSIVMDDQNTFLTAGRNVSGPYWLVKYNTRARREIWRANITAFTQARYAGFQDVTVDARGNSYVIGTYPSSILRIDKTGKKITAWYPPQTRNTTIHGYAGVASVGETLLVADANGVPEGVNEGNSEIYRFDMTRDKGRPVLIPRRPKGIKLGIPDSLRLPEKYGGKLMLMGENYVGVTVLRSDDGWRTAEQLGTIKSDFPRFPDKAVSSTVQIGQRQFMFGQIFPESIVPGTKGGNITDFPFFDITDQVESLLSRPKGHHPVEFEDLK